MEPSPIPGKTYMLLPDQHLATLRDGKWRTYFPWLGIMILSLWRYGRKGLPLAKRALPSVCLMASSKVHSELLEGFDKGKMIGLGFNFAMVLRMFSSKMPRMVERPMRIVGLT